MNAEAYRQRMVQTQIEVRGISDPRLLEALKKVPRHLFAEEENLERAYGDFPLPIGCGQTISQPYIVAYMTEILDLKGHERILEIGTGCGYQTAVLAEMARRVHTVEIKQALSDGAQKKLAALGYDNIRYKIGNGRDGWLEEAPYDGILVTAATESVPPALTGQLAPGGRLILPLGGMDQALVCYRKTEIELSSETLIAVRFVPLL